MFKKIVSVGLISLFGLMISACGNTAVEQAPQPKTEVAQSKAVTNEEAENVLKQFEATQSSVTYKDPSSFNAGDKYLTPEFAKKYHEQIRGGMEPFIKDSKGIVSGKAPKITFNKQEGNNITYNYEVDRIITLEQTKQSITSHVESLVTVTKQKDGSYLISDMAE